MRYYFKRISLSLGTVREVPFFDAKTAGTTFIPHPQVLNEGGPAKIAKCNFYQLLKLDNESLNHKPFGAFNTPIGEL